jgi:ribosomal protein L7/L12
MTTNEIKDEIVKIKSKETLDTLAQFCVSLQSILKYSKPLDTEYDITLTRKVKSLLIIDESPTVEYGLYIQGFKDDKKIHTIKVVKEITGWGLKETKEAVEDRFRCLKTYSKRDDMRSDIDLLRNAGGLWYTTEKQLKE